MTMRALILCLVSSLAFAGQVPLKPPAGYTPLSAYCAPMVTVNTYATGYDTSGNITGVIHSTAHCGLHNYSHWDSVLWDAAGNYLTLLAYDGVAPGPFVNNAQLQFSNPPGDTTCWAAAQNALAVVTSCWVLAPGAHSFLLTP
jgi:hypothetical protein